MDTSPVTIRKDVAALAQDNLVVKYHGKISLSENCPIPYALRSESNNQKKLAIAKAALPLLEKARSIALDSGTTTSIFANELLTLPPMNIVTNSLAVANVLLTSEHDVSLTGGQLSGHSKCLIGPDTEEYLSRVKTDYAFISCTGIRDGVGLCTGMRLEASVKKALLKAGIRVVALIDDSKFFTTSMFVFADFSEINILVTNREVENLDCIRRIQDMGVQVIFAD